MVDGLVVSQEGIFESGYAGDLGASLRDRAALPR